ncbi:MAG: hypothetical protein D6739_09450 [Nitrospirae bacterium]|nr:MAG: hypothetical protein D6739_09450 [Nitrospirota bacterium]
MSEPYETPRPFPLFRYVSIATLGVVGAAAAFGLAAGGHATGLLAVASMAVLYLALLGIVRRADRRLRADRAQIEASRRALAEQRDRLDTILSHLEEGVALYDEARRIVFMNRPLVERFGDRRGERCYEALFGLDRPCCSRDGDGDEACRSAWFSLMAPGGSYFELFSTPIQRPDGGCWTLELVRDISGRVSLERERAARDEALARERQAAVEQLLVGLNHELNNSLMGIVSALHVADREGLSEAERHEVVARIRAEVERLRAVVTRLPRITELGSVEYVGGVTMVDPWLVPKGRAEADAPPPAGGAGGDMVAGPE